MISIQEEGNLQKLIDIANPSLMPMCQIVDSNDRVFNVGCEGMIMENGRLGLQMNHPDLVCMSREEYESTSKITSGEHVMIPKSKEHARSMVAVAMNYLGNNYE
ncbi:MAG: hypothetical protein CL489_08690 [Acidobacteria bacterium]|nr:hypothetical protein [Acidobacteriota bacterium]|tara:strand:- start:30336 stop:30647 length:312 start_codon:yes stop_codon:yes gene_type:complete